MMKSRDERRDARCHGKPAEGVFPTRAFGDVRGSVTRKVPNSIATVNSVARGITERYQPEHDGYHGNCDGRATVERAVPVATER